MMRSKVSRNFVLLAPPGCGEVSANKSANVGALIFIVTLFGSVLIIAYHPPFVQRFLKSSLSKLNLYFLFATIKQKMEKTTITATKQMAKIINVVVIWSSCSLTLMIIESTQRIKQRKP